jgi:hypothetical protein
MKPVREVVTREIIDDLWGAGYTILPRRRHPDPFYIDPAMIPVTRAYQWWHLVHDRGFFGGTSGWAPVPASRHDGYFMPAGFVGDIEVNGLGLFDKPEFEVREAQAAAVQKAKDAADPVKFFVGKGFDGTVVMSHQDETGAIETTAKIGTGGAAHVNEETKTFNPMIMVPVDMMPHMGAIFAERDRLVDELVSTWNGGWELTDQQRAWALAYNDALERDADLLKGPTLNTIVLPTAVNTIRSRIKQESSNGD